MSMFRGKSPEGVYILKFHFPSIVKTADRRFYQYHPEATESNPFLAHIQSHPRNDQNINEKLYPATFTLANSNVQLYTVRYCA